MSLAARQPLPPELGPSEIDDRSVLAFKHGFPDELVRWHCHDDYELHFIVASFGKMFIGDHVGAFAPGQFVMTGPRLPHNWISQTQAGEIVPVRDLVVQFRQELMPRIVAAAPELQMLLPLLERSRRGIEFTGPIRFRAAQWFERMIDCDGPGRIIALIEFLSDLSTEIDYQLLSTLPIRSETDEFSLAKIERVTQYVSDHYAHEIPLATVANLVGMSESAFSRFFARETGNGFNRFLNRVRIAKACELLADSERAITDICFEVGFNNVANFNRRFRELKDVTPSQYRKQSRLRARA